MLSPFIFSHKCRIASIAGKRSYAAVHKHMHLQRPLLRVLLPANRAWPANAIVCIQMPTQVALLLVALRTSITSVRLFARMLAAMQYQITNSCEFLITIRTLYRFARMQCHMRLQNCVLRKATSANRTAVRSFAGMRTHVTRQSIGLRKHLAALLAMVWSFAGVRSTVRPQTVFGGKAHRAHVAGMRSFAGVRMGMNAQPLGGSEAFAAGGTEETMRRKPKVRLNTFNTVSSLAEILTLNSLAAVDAPVAYAPVMPVW